MSLSNAAPSPHGAATTTTTTTTATTAAAQLSSSSLPSTAVELAPAMRQRTIAFTAAGLADTAPLTLHLSIRCLVDYILLFVTEDATCAPGVVVRYDAPAMGPAAFMYEGETPSLEFAVLLGLRDHPLTNMLASSIAHRIRRYGEGRPLLMGLSVVKTAKQLSTAAAKKEFLDMVASQLLDLAGEARDAERRSEVQ